MTGVGLFRASQALSHLMAELQKHWPQDISGNDHLDVSTLKVHSMTHLKLLSSKAIGKV